MMNENIYKMVAAALLCTTILAGAYALNLQYNCSRLENENQLLLDELEEYTIQVNLMIDYGNGSKTWYNDTRIQAGANLLDLTIVNCDPVYEVYDFGAFVTSINGVASDDGHFWAWYQFEDNQWNMGTSGADQFVLHDGYTVGWIYTGL